MSTRFAWLVLVFLTISAAVFAQDKPVPTSAPAATQPAATEWTLPQQDDINLLLPAGENIYYLCADNNKEGATPGGPPIRKRYSTYMGYNTKTGSVSNVLLSIPGRFDPDKLMVFGFTLSPDRKLALMNVSSPSGSSLGGLYMMDLVKNKARKFPPTGGTWVGGELVVTVRDGQSRYVQLARYGTTGAKLGTLPICGEILAADEQGKNLMVVADPKNLNKPLTEEHRKDTAKPLVVSKDGKSVTEVTAPPSGNMSVLSPNLKFTNAQKGGSMRVYSLDGKKEWVLQGLMKVLYVGDEGEVLSLTYANGNSLLGYWDNTGKKVWDGPPVGVAAFYDGKVYYIEAANPKVIKCKVLVEKKLAE
jgi:hypothetical protein